MFTSVHGLDTSRLLNLTNLNGCVCLLLYIILGGSNNWYAYAENLPDDWSGAPDIHEFQSFDRSFVFPGINFSLAFYCSIMHSYCLHVL